MTAAIIASDSSTFAILQSALKSTQFKLPFAEGMENKHLIPVSGGNDSTALAILLCCLFPHVDFKLIFTDTRAEPQATYDNLDLLEETLGRKIVRLVPKKGLFELIDSYGGFLPSQQARWCTRQLKIQTFDRYINETLAGDNVRVWSYVGIRFDENRFGFISEDTALQMVFPFKEMGIQREEVYEIVSRTLGIAKTYQTRSRSGCTVCPFQRRSELAGLLLESPEDFAKGQSYEKLTASDVERFQKLEDWKGAFIKDGVAMNALRFPVPSKIDARTFHLPEIKRRVHGVQAGGSLDMFGVTEDEHYDDLYVAVSFLSMPEINLWKSGVEASGVWMQNFITYSSSLGGLKKALNYYFRHRLATPEVWSLSKSSLEKELNIGIYHLRVEKGVLDFAAVDDDSYTWRSDVSYVQLKHTVKVAHDVLYRAYLESEVTMYSEAEELTWEYEQLEYFTAELERLGETCGTIHWSGRYEAPDEARLIELTTPRSSEDAKAANDSGENKSVCFACSI